MQVLSSKVEMEHITLGLPEGKNGMKKKGVKEEEKRDKEQKRQIDDGFKYKHASNSIKYK